MMAEKTVREIVVEGLEQMQVGGAVAGLTNCKGCSCNGIADDLFACSGVVDILECVVTIDGIVLDDDGPKPEEVTSEQD